MNNYINLVEVNKKTGIPVARLRNLIINGQINGVTIPGSPDMGFVDQDTVDDLLKEIR